MSLPRPLLLVTALVVLVVAIKQLVQLVSVPHATAADLDRSAMVSGDVEVTCDELRPAGAIVRSRERLDEGGVMSSVFLCRIEGRTLAVVAQDEPSGSTIVGRLTAFRGSNVRWPDVVTRDRDTFLVYLTVGSRWLWLWAGAGFVGGALVLAFWLRLWFRARRAPATL